MHLHLSIMPSCICIFLSCFHVVCLFLFGCLVFILFVFQNKKRKIKKIQKRCVFVYICICVTSEYKLSDLWLLSYLICLLWFCHRLPKGEIIRTYVIHLLRTFATILCNWLILWQNTFYLYLSRSMMYLILQETVFQDQVLKICKSVQETSWRSACH